MPVSIGITMRTKTIMFRHQNTLSLVIMMTTRFRNKLCIKISNKCIFIASWLRLLTKNAKKQTLCQNTLYLTKVRSIAPPTSSNLIHQKMLSLLTEMKIGYIVSLKKRIRLSKVSRHIAIRRSWLNDADSGGCELRHAELD